MERVILRTLLNWGSVTGWELWAEEEGIAEQLGLRSDAKGRDYPKYKRAIDKLESQGYIEKGTAERRLAKAEWRITEAGKRFADQSDITVDQATEGDDMLKRRISFPVDREVWKVMMNRFRSGEVDVVFLTKPSKTKITGGSGR